MAPILNSAFNFDQIHHDSTVPTMSRTHQYRKVMKPLLERKRRARINKCLDELKDLMVFAVQSECADKDASLVPAKNPSTRPSPPASPTQRTTSMRMTWLCCFGPRARIHLGKEESKSF